MKHVSLPRLIKLIVIASLLAIGGCHSSESNAIHASSNSPAADAPIAPLELPGKATKEQLAACKNQVTTEFATLSLADVGVAAALPDAKGNAVINWRTTQGAAGTCRIDSFGRIVNFAVVVRALGTPPPRPAASPTAVPKPPAPKGVSPTQAASSSPAAIVAPPPPAPYKPPQVTAAQVKSCKQQVAAQLADVPAPGVQVDAAFPDVSGNALVIWATNRGGGGYCQVNASNQVTDFVVSNSGQPAVASPSPPPTKPLVDPSPVLPTESPIESLPEPTPPPATPSATPPKPAVRDSSVKN